MSSNSKRRSRGSEEKDTTNKKSKKSHSSIQSVPETDSAPVYVEKRAARTRYSASNDTMARIERALSQRLYLLNQDDISTPGNLGKKYDVLGSTGNVYEVVISKHPRCSCPDFERGHLCKHILFVYIRVLHCRADSNIIIQKALLPEELRSILTTSSPISNGVTANKDILRAFSTIVNPSSSQKVISLIDSESETETEPPSKQTEFSEPPDGECPICFESMDPAKESIERCTTCRNYLHSDCLKRWLGQSLTCVYCRSPWTIPPPPPPKNSLHRRVSIGQVGGYVNLTSLS